MANLSSENQKQLQVNTVNSLDGLVNGLLIGFDPLGIAFSKYTGYEKTLGNYGWENNGNGRVKEIKEHLIGSAADPVNNPDIDTSSYSFITSKSVGAVLGLAANWYTFGAFQFAYTVINTLASKVDTVSKP